ncbi:uncharacterized protein LOC127834096 isoform X6 [Dreissena polymorpha]|uniref:uncharacterized protein LOC127834096 isoform X2 n=1 Tax=Dreissena polymorpha TaxID=45954 RepID=UPI002264ED9B|nr:uncharacterized protein LOC127834096 isoform X2 [Dreissena polymorpha]XP_052215661.1 uncharacterized protein LOC127834096 isoform X3 [Dreissena polymorpha]XP_052215662.1 uncharacterized protein LOC127834096 isoform X4 [Dreissena polymorpha]XP_052215664.1 uncharacterized protein LOC127834096 isoform X6 [Dreissena polymorpha]
MFVNIMTTHSQYSIGAGYVRVSFFHCASCNDKNIVETAVCYCSKCEQCLCTQCCGLHDQLFSKHIKYGLEELENWPDCNDLVAFLQICEIHKNQSVDMFCKDHRRLCCYECVSSMHRNCTNVTLDPAEMHSTEVHELLIRLQINLVKLNKLQSCCESRIHDLTTLYQEHELMVCEIHRNINSNLDKIEKSSLKKTPEVEQSMVKILYQSIHSFLDELKESTLNEAKQTISDHQASQKTCSETCKIYYTELKLLQEALQYSSDKSNLKFCLIATHKCKEKLLYLDNIFVKLQNSVLKQPIIDIEQYLSKLSGLSTLVQSSNEVTYQVNTDIEQLLYSLSKLVTNVFSNVFSEDCRSEHNECDETHLKTQESTINKYSSLKKENAQLKKENAKLRSDLSSELSRTMKEKSREEILETSKKNERVLTQLYDDVLEQLTEKEKEIRKLTQEFKQSFDPDDKKRLQEQLARKQDQIVHLRNQERVMKKQIGTLEEIVKILEHSSTSTDECTNQSEPEKLEKLLENEVELKVELSLILERKESDERLYYSNVSTMTDFSSLGTSDDAVNEDDQHSKGYTTMKSTPGKPSASEVGSDTITLTWDKPALFKEGDHFQISCRENKESRWRICHDSVEINRFELTNVKSESQFMFRIRAVYTDFESDYSKESDIVTTKKSPASQLVGFSTARSAPDVLPIQYALPMIEVEGARNTIGKTRKFEIGSPRKGYWEEKTILLIGETETGKSTLLDGMANFILGVNWNDEFRFSIANLEDKKRHKFVYQAVSQTEWITCYTIHPQDGGRIPYTINIIDTPGFGDTRGPQRDEEIVEQIIELFTVDPPKGVSIIDSVCFCVKAQDVRLTPRQSNIFQWIMSMLGKDIKANICSMITFADGLDPPVKNALQMSYLPFGKLFSFNNSALFAKNTKSDSPSLSPIFWDMSLQSFRIFFKHLETLPSTSLKLTSDVLKERHELEAIGKNLQPRLDVGLMTINSLNAQIKSFKENTSIIAANKETSHTLLIQKKLIDELKADLNKTSTSPRGEVVQPEWAEQRSRASRGRQGSLMKNKGGYSMTGLSEEVQDNLESGVATLSVYQTGTNHISLGQLSPISDGDITFEFSIMEHNGDSSPLRGEVTIPSLLSHEVGLPNFSLVPDPLGITRITDISPTDVTHVKNFALLELTSMYDTYNISYTRRRSKKRYKEHGIFGVPLQTLLEHDQKLAPDTRVPIVYQEILHYLSKNCLDPEGILRIPGSSTRIKTLRQEMEEKFYQGTFVWGPDLTPNDVAALMQQFLRDLPVPLLTDEYIDAFAQVEELSDKKQQLHALNLLVILLPTVHRDTLGALLDLLLEIISHSDTNKMSLNKVAMIMAPNLFLAPKIGNANIGKNKDALDLEIKMARGTSNIVRMIIRYKHILWTIPTYLLGLVRRQYEQDQVRRNKEKSKMKFLAKKDKTDVYKKPALKHEADFQEGVIRVQAPSLTKSSTAIQLDQSMTARDIISRFTVSPLKTDSKKSSSKDKKFIAADVDTYLYEVGGNIGERCLPDNTNMLALYKVNPNAEWVLKHRQRLKAV